MATAPSTDRGAVPMKTWIALKAQATQKDEGHALSGWHFFNVTGDTLIVCAE